jgi:hypothetical protein
MVQNLEIHVTIYGTCGILQKQYVKTSSWSMYIKKKKKKKKCGQGQ